MGLATQLKQCAEFLSECPHPNKVVFRSAAKARKRAREIGGLTHYKCVCGSWHLTTDLKNPKPLECPICGAPVDDGWTDCGCHFDLCFGDRD